MGEEHDEALVEAVARALAEITIRDRRRFDTKPDDLNAMITAAIDYAWREFKRDAVTALTARDRYMAEQVQL